MWSKSSLSNINILSKVTNTQWNILFVTQTKVRFPYIKQFSACNLKNLQTA
jgi:hypothetical protein